MNATSREAGLFCWAVGRRSGCTPHHELRESVLCALCAPVVNHFDVMKIGAITLREIQMPLVHFFETSFKRTFSRQILLLTVHCDGINAWGECVAGEDPFYSSEWTESAWPTIKHYLAPAVLGRTLSSAHESVALMARVRGHDMAKAAVENALWDAEAQEK